MAKKIALVFGASGQDGTFMCKLLKDKNISVYKNWIITKRSFKPFQLNLDLENPKQLVWHLHWQE